MNLFVAILLCFCLNPVSLSDYPETMDRGTLSDQEYAVYLDILEAAEQGKECIPYHGEVSHTKILTHLGMYYGSTDGISGLYAGNDDTLFLDLDLFQTFQQQKETMDHQVEEILCHIREGSDRYKLKQIAKHISRSLSYSDDVVCRHYAMLFYKTASRLDIKTYLCYGYVGGEYHAWNMVELDGKQYHYDVTWYDNTLKLPIYLHSTGWGREYALNDLWGNNQ